MFKNEKEFLKNTGRDLKTGKMKVIKLPDGSYFVEGMMDDHGWHIPEEDMQYVLKHIDPQFIEFEDQSWKRQQRKERFYKYYLQRLIELKANQMSDAGEKNITINPEILGIEDPTKKKE